MRNLIVCGGGSGGHVLPALTVLREVRERYPNVQILCIGSYKGIEAELFQKADFPYRAISTGKLRRYFSWQNFSDIFKIFWGMLQSYFLCWQFSRKDTVVFCTGGFVTVPVAFACWLQRKKIIIHEQTSRVGLANRICSLFAEEIIISFEESKEYFPPSKTLYLGYPLRREIFEENDKRNLKSDKTLKLDTRKPILFLTGGGNGSSLLNKVLFELKDELSSEFHIIHQCGQLEYEQYRRHEDDGYQVREFIGQEMIYLLDQAKVVISRAGAGTVVELIALGKPSIFVPLKIAQKNEQYHNAMEANKKMGSIVIKEDDFNCDSLREAISQIKDLKRAPKETANPTDKIVSILLGDKE